MTDGERTNAEIERRGDPRLRSFVFGGLSLGEDQSFAILHDA